MHASQQAKSIVPFSFGDSSDCENEDISTPIVDKQAKKTFQITSKQGAHTVKVVIIPTIKPDPSFLNFLKKSASKPWSKFPHLANKLPHISGGEFGKSLDADHKSNRGLG